MRAFLFGESPRAPRTSRALCAAGVEVARDLDADVGDGGVWLVRAGAWPAASPIAPAESATGLPLCAIGRTRAPAGEPVGPRERAWDDAIARSGGDLARLGGEVPEIASAFLDAAARRMLARRIARGEPLERALRALVTTADVRVVRVPALDVYDDPRLRLALVTTSLQQGGAERIVIDLVRALRARDVAVLPAVLGRPTRRAFAAPEGLIDLSDLRGDRAERAEALVRACVAFGADALHAHLLDRDDLARLAPSGIPVVVTVHNARGGWPDGLEALGREDAALLVACSRAAESDLAAARLPVPARTVWNGIDPRPSARSARRDTRARLGIPEDAIALLSVANPRPQKRLHLLPAIARAVSRSARREAHLVVAGAASPAGRAAEEELGAAIATHGMEARAHLLGSVDDVAPLYAAADVLVAPSAYEGLSLAHLEALAAGLPVVTSEVGGAGEVGARADGVHLVPADSPIAAYAARISDAVAGGRGARLPESFTLARMTERYVELTEHAARIGRSPRGGDGVLVVTNNFSTGGAQSSLRRLLVGLAARGVRARAAVLEEREDHPTPGLRALRDAGVPVFVAPTAGSHDPQTTARSIVRIAEADPPAALLFVNAIFEHKLLLADVLYDVPIFDASPGEMYFASIDRYFARPRPGLPYLTARDYGARLTGAIVKYAAEAARADAALGTRVHVVPNGVPIAEPRERPARTGPLVLGTCARIAPQKKLEELVDALRLASPRMPPYVLRVAGACERGGEAYADALRARARGLPVEWLGERDDVRELLAELDLFAMISQPAGCPNASLEAMAAGLPVIATDVGGASEQIEDGVTGRLVPRADPRALADALVDAARDRARLAAWGRAGHARAARRFDVRRMVDDYARVLGVLRNAACAPSSSHSGT